ncbi:IS3 family transposase [Pandoraea communis]|uniref:IS3 family transposase n=1 Tax=Pandoraea communis TaxID=2508297 RepID=A0A5E4Z223_9BURK|nr:IS3 family transposase [Pandoraea communis]
MRGGVNGYRKVTADLRETGEACSRLLLRHPMKGEGQRAQTGYYSKPRYRGGPVGNPMPFPA